MPYCICQSHLSYRGKGHGTACPCHPAQLAAHKKLRRDLKKLLDYCQPDEEKHYEESKTLPDFGYTAGTSTTGHIVHTIRRLRKTIS